MEAEELENGTQSNVNSKIVYDCLDPSPFYENHKEQFINENEFVDLGPIEDEKDMQGQAQNGRGNPSKLPSSQSVQSQQ